MLADDAAGVAQAARGATGAALQTALDRLSGFDQTILSSQARDVIGFIVASASRALTGRATSLEDSMDRSATLYLAIAESARWHIAVLSGEDLRG